MSPNYPSSQEDSPFGVSLPIFIRENPGMEYETNPFNRFNFWAPDRSGIVAADLSLGRQHFETALAIAQAGQLSNLLANIVGSMCSVGAGPIEKGFLEPLSRKATFARIPDPVSDAMAESAILMCGRTIEELRHGEDCARECLVLCRDELKDHSFAYSLMIDAVNREFGYGAFSFIWTVCAGAYVGSAH